MHILITRPEADAAELAAHLATRNIETTLEPLLVIKPATVAIELDGVQAILFTSANGVRGFAAQNARRDIKVFTVGDNSATEARALGFAPVFSAGGDVESLAKLVTERLNPRDGALLHAAGANLAGDLRGQLQAAGFVVNRVVLYDAVPVTELSPATVMNLRLGGIDAVALFSPRTARIFAELWGRAQNGSESGLAAATALCLSDAVAAEIRNLGWRHVAVAATPDRAGMLALIEGEKAKGESAMAESNQEANAGAAGPESGAGDSEAAQGAAADAARGAAIIAAVPPPRTGRAGAILAGLIAGAVAGVGTIATEPLWRPYLPLGTPIATDTSGLAAEVAALKEQLAGLGAEQDVDTEARNSIAALQNEISTWKTELEAAAGQAAPAPIAAMDLAPLEGRLEALEGRVASLSEKLAAAPVETTSQEPEPEPAADAATLSTLESRFGALEAKLAELDALSSENATQKAEIETTKAKLANLEALESRLTSLEEGAATLSGDLETLAREQGDAALKRQRAAALVLASGQLRGALSGDQPFSAELAALEDLARPDADLTAQLQPALEPIRAVAATGAPTLSQLQASFPATEIAQAATADAAGAAIGAEEGWMQQTLNRLSELITVRPVGDVAGEGALAILARAENKLGSGDLAGAAAEAGQLSGQAADATAAWLAQARARLAIDAAAAQLTAVSAAALAPAADPAQSQSN